MAFNPGRTCKTSSVPVFMVMKKSSNCRSAAPVSLSSLSGLPSGPAPDLDDELGCLCLLPPPPPPLLMLILFLLLEKGE